MIVRKAGERGHAHHGWLDTWHTFSFDTYDDPNHRNFGPLRVMNEDRIAPGGAFPTHPHRDMEILTCVLEGELRHKDSLGNGSVIRAGDFQYMSAGTGVLHSEENPSASSPTHLYQIWIFPGERGLEPAYAQKSLEELEFKDGLALVASPDGRRGSIAIRQDADVHRLNLETGRRVRASLRNPLGWLQVMRGSVRVSGQMLEAGDGISFSDAKTIEVEALKDSDLLLFDLPHLVPKKGSP
ncbi:MAG: pirin family protein [Planctomycetota bacterium]